MSADVVDAEVVPDDEAGALVPAGSTTLAVTPSVGADDLVQRLEVIREASQTAMKKDVDFGEVPGTNKPTLLKPGAEKLSVLFQLDIQIENEKLFDGDHLTVVSKAVAFHAPSGTRLGYGEGMCSTREKKYAYRRGERLCPECGKPAIIKGKAEYGGGWLCFRKKDGCGAKFDDRDERITGQQVGDVPNPDLPDLWNTVVKMAQKRARVDAVLAVTGASALFTQDVEDEPVPSQADVPPPPRPRQQGPSRPQVLADLIGSHGFTDEETDRIRGWIQNEQGKADPGRTEEAIELLQKGDRDGLLGLSEVPF